MKHNNNYVVSYDIKLSGRIQPEKLYTTVKYTATFGSYAVSPHMYSDSNKKPQLYGGRIFNATGGLENNALNKVTYSIIIITS